MVTQPTFVEHRIPVEQGTIYARDYEGAEPAYVLMHGFPDNLRIYDDLIPYLVRGGRRVVAFDFLGYGASEKRPGAVYSFAQQLADLEAVADTLQLRRIVPVPHDASGPAAINYAIEHPERVASMGILNSAYDNSPLNVWPEMIVLFADPGLRALAMAMAGSAEQFGWLLGWQRERFAAALPDAQKRHFEEFLGPLIAENFTAQPGSGPAFVQMAAQFDAELSRNSQRLPLLSALDIPVKVIWGVSDPYLSRALGEERASRFKNGSFQPIAAGHWLQADAPELVARALLS